jgi:hypothetical protein
MIVAISWVTYLYVLIIFDFLKGRREKKEMTLARELRLANMLV